ncbi:hypothetical protein [Roseimaritima ulvae]|uniref:Uncharacterized protein n=1 Tax=Roseimaritima ulvae TaxID=980254 RepID=A0A5B9QTE7_9BACT|nr:hypothetical protein [Roseimaritima ulvae]QEG41020.1 hypothetical protein UC8_30380 [Roseimaritima ulvae]
MNLDNAIARFVLVVVCLAPLTAGADELPFRTDADTDDAKPWFELVDGEFPPEHSAHAISGELIRVDHLERQFYLRVDRDDSQQRGNWDLPLDATMLPYGSIYYHGAPAALQDIPLGTHMHGLFYVKASDDQSPPPPGRYGRTTKEVKFKRCFRLEDEFSFHRRQQQQWVIESVDLDDHKLTAVLQQDGKPLGAAKTFDLLNSSRVMVGDGFGTLESLQPGHTVLFNLTWVTLYGPGRILQIWTDQPSRDLATTHQLQRHHQHVRERGLPGWVEAVDDEAEIVTITFFDGVDPALFEALHGTSDETHGWPFAKPEDDPKAPKGGIAVARQSLMTYDPVNDRKGGNILSIVDIPKQPGCGGVQIRVQCGMLLEGFRPKHIVRFYPAPWKVEALPREEQFHGRE